MNNYSTSNRPVSAVLHMAGLCLLGLSSCAHQPAEPIYAGKLSYPKTEITLKHSLKLMHIAGDVCTDESRPEVGTSDGARTFSVYELLDVSGRKLCECPSGLSDPKFAGEFEAYHRENDEIRVLQSDTGNTVLIIEDRSPTFPRIALLLLSKDARGEWQPTELLAPHVRGSPLNIYGYYAGALGITDKDIRFDTGKKQWSEAFAKVRKPTESSLKF